MLNYCMPTSSIHDGRYANESSSEVCIPGVGGSGVIRVTIIR